MNDIKKANMFFDERLKKINENLSGIRRKIAVISGKGGVGKTTIAVNLAAFLAKDENVALLDGDIDCPNVNSFLGIKEGFSIQEERIIPNRRYNMSVVSFASFLEREDQPVIWRGPMLSKAIMQLLEQVEWGRQNYLIADLPPGTGDAPLTIMQIMKPDGVIVVTMPQTVAAVDARRAANMVNKLGVPVLGIIENMSGNLFGTGGGKKLANDLGVKFLGKLELNKEIAVSGERGKPFILSNRKSGEEFIYITEKIKEILG